MNSAKDLAKYQAKSITPVDDYECTLSQDLRDILEREIRETDELRTFAIKAMRDWMVQNPRIIKGRLDSIWLLKHLRFKKYSLPLAQEAIERHMVLRQGLYAQEYFHPEADITRPCIKKVFDQHPVCLLPDRDKYGRAVLLVVAKNVRPTGECILKDIMTTVALVLEMLTEIEEFHIRGLVYIIDVSGISRSYIKILPIENAVKLTRNSEKCATGRHKGFHIINVPPVMSYLINIAMKTASEKIQQRIKFYNSFDDESFDVIDRKCLPKEYGGTIPMEQMSKELWEMMMKKRDLHMKYDTMRVNESMYPKACLDGSLEMLKVPLNSDDLFEKATRCSNDTIYGVQGSFRKLEID